MRPRLLALFCLLTVPASLRADEPVDYLRDIKPILQSRCYSCHGALKQKGSLRVDTAALLKKGGDSGEGVVPGKSAESVLIDAVTGANGLTRMPAEGEPLKPEQIDLLKKWIDQGAVAPAEKTPDDPRQHWAYQRPAKAPLPLVKNAARVRNPIDNFIAAEHERLGISPAPSAEKHVLLRRVYLDLIGLPPTRDELHAFLNDSSPDAYEKVVDRLLAHPQYGVRWGRHWMDVWRYSDWAGYGKQVRDSQPHIWRWRDWIVESLNEDKGYDRMVLEMLAGDELAPEDESVLRATGYLVRNYKLLSRETWMQDTVNHTAKSFLATTLECARCHDHFYDPLLQSEYYQLRAIFEPYNVRTDRLPGKPDTALDGLPRAYDAKADAETFLYIRGDDRFPDKEKPLAPGVPKILGGDYQVASVSLPTPAYYPAVKNYIKTESLTEAILAIEKAKPASKTATAALQARRELIRTIRDPLEAALAITQQHAPSGQAQREVESALQKLSELAASALKPTELAVQIAERQLAAAEAHKISIEKRIAADHARFAKANADAVTESAREAARAERHANVLKAEAAVSLTEFQLLSAQQALKPEDAKSKTALTAAEKALVDARKALESAQMSAQNEAPNYTPLVPEYPATSTGRRLAFARWLVSRDNPLAARVAVNHVWSRHFGQPIVPTVFDFGINGKRPTHPALLDWLAVDLMDHTWNLKHLHRLIVTSNTYRMSSSESGQQAETNPQSKIQNPKSLDPDNLFLWHFPSRRMEAEIVRDSVLYVTGQLDLTPGGPELDHTNWLATKRRSIYFRHAQEKQVTFMKIFDAAPVNECYTRKESIIPQQALALINSELTLHNARHLARTLSPSTNGSAQFITIAFESILSRTPTPDELSTCTEFLAKQQQLFTTKRDQLTGTTTDTTDLTKPTADPALHARENFVHVLLNHNDFVTVR